jgi:hypothetical protein
VSIPAAFEIIRKPFQFCDLETKKLKRASEVTKNEQMRTLNFLMDCWFWSVENFDYIKKDGKHFISALKDNRLVALSEDDKQTLCTDRYAEIIGKLRCAGLSDKLCQCFSSPGLYKTAS